MNAAYGNIDCGVSIILAAPFITERNTPSWLPRLTHRCQAKGVDVTSIWIHSNLDTMHGYIEQRDAPTQRLEAGQLGRVHRRPQHRRPTPGPHTPPPTTA